MARTIILSVSTFGIIGVCFAIYQLSVGNIEQEVDTFPVEAHAAFLNGEEQKSLTGDPLKIRDMEISPGEKPRITIYNASLEAKVKWRADFWEPRDENTMYMEMLDLEYLLSGGEVAHLKADEAEIIMQKSGGSNFIPRRGWLKGNILVVIDRSTKEWRNANPDQRLPEQRPDDVIRIWFDELEFDLELAFLRTEGDFRVQSTDIDIEATGLEVHWNEPDNRIERLTITKGKRMELKRGGDAVAFTMPGTAQEEVIEPTDAAPSSTAMASATVDVLAATSPPAESKAESNQQPAQANAPITVAANRPVSVETSAAASSAEAGAVPEQQATAMEPAITLADDEKEKEEKPVTTYVINIDGDIKVEQIQGVKVISQLLAQHLRMTRDMNASILAEPRTLPTKEEQEQKEAAEKNAAQAEQTPQDDNKTPAEPQDQTRLVLLWDGPLHLEPDPTTAPKDEFTGKRFHIEATGAPVRLNTAQGKAVCKVLRYHDETKRVWLEGTADIPVDVISDGTRRLHARDLVHFDRSTGKARLEGPGFLTDSRGGPVSLTASTEGVSPERLLAEQAQPIEIRWADHIDLQFNQETRVVYDPDLKQEITKRRTYLESVKLEGDVKIDQAGQVLAGDHVTIQLGKPQADSGLGDNIESILAKGHVVLESKKDRVTCDRLDIEMLVSPDGKNLPNLAKAYGHVVAIQGNRRIEAAERMIVKMGLFAKPPIPWDLTRAKAFARSKGVDPTHVDWDVQQKKWEQKQAKRTDVGITDLHGFGNVTAIDPSQNLDLRCVELKCRFSQGEQIEHAVIVGPKNGWAYVGINDFIIEGQTVTVDNVSQSVDVPGSGRLRFWARQDLDGRPSDEPVPAVVNWSKKLELKGDENFCEFTGKVLAETPSNLFRGEQLRIDFFDVPRDTKAAPGRSDQWIIGPLVHATTSKPASGTNQPTFSKKPRYLTATGDATVVTSSFDNGTLGNTYVDQFAQSLKSAVNRFKSRFGEQPKVALGEPVIPAPTERGRLLNRMRIAGPTLTVDFRKETLNVNGRGNLLIEEYRLPDRRTARVKTAPSDPVLGNLGGGPSQTLIRWGNSMSFFSERNLAVFDQLVHMVHRAGPEMALSDKLATAFNVDVESLRRLKGRRASLTADNLLVEFAAAPGQSTGDMLGSQAGTTELNQFRATGSAHLQESTKSVMGEEIVYSRQANIVTVIGSEKIEASIFDQDESQRRLRSVRGSKLRWYRDDNRIEIENGTFLSRGG